MRRFKFYFDRSLSVKSNQQKAERAGAKVGDLIVVNRDTYYERIDARESVSTGYYDSRGKEIPLKHKPKWEKR